jgi:hypothetical protein
MTTPAASHFAPQEPAGGCLHDLELGDAGFAHPFNLGEPRGRRRDHLGERAKGRDQGLGERLDVAPGQGAEQHRFQKLIIRQRLGSGLAETLAQTFAMAVVVRRRFGEAAVVRALFVQHCIRDAVRTLPSDPKDDRIAIFCNRVAKPWRAPRGQS